MNESNETFLNSFKRKRTLTEYPTGEYRWTLLLLTVLAAVLVSYEFQLAPVLPYLLPFLHLSKLGYGYFVSATLLISAASAFFGGPFADRYGRVVIIDGCLLVVTAMVFANLLIVGLKSFLLIRITMSVVAGLMAGALAALVRDMSPRLSRALAFGLLTIGPVGSNFIAASIAGVTLPIYQTWQSQMWIMGFSAIAMYLPLFFLLKDLSPELRMKIYQSEITAIEVEGGKVVTAAELPGTAREAFASLLKHFEPWLMVWPFTISLSLYIAIQAFGPLIFTESFHYTPGDAAAMCSWFWGGNIIALVIVGIISDGLQLRKPISIFGTILTCILLVWWIPTFGEALPRATMRIVATLLGCCLAILTVPWAAQYSESLEEISPAIQATGWAFYGLATRGWLAISIPVMVIVAGKYGWATWLKFSFAAFVLFGVAMFFSHPSKVPTRATKPKPKAKPQPATA
jgi:MFS family permease